ncbi:MAG: hypothetical protein LLF80_01525 [Porphyromonadaceae bacterium]|nr:hypothetical protein [Porphyromonadaceae bacterium]
MKKFAFTFVMFSFLYLMATWANYLVILPERPYLWWLHILFALLTGTTGVIITYFQNKRKEKKKE